MFCKIDAYGNPTVPGLLSLAGQMKMGRGLLMAVGLLEGDMVEVSASLSCLAHEKKKENRDFSVPCFLGSPARGLMYPPLLCLHS